MNYSRFHLTGGNTELEKLENNCPFQGPCWWKERGEKQAIFLASKAMVRKRCSRAVHYLSMERKFFL
jgi:hypothetical protein